MGRRLWLARFPLEILVKVKTTPFPFPQNSKALCLHYCNNNEIKRLPPNSRTRQFRTDSSTCCTNTLILYICSVYSMYFFHLFSLLSYFLSGLLSYLLSGPQLGDGGFARTTGILKKNFPKASFSKRTNAKSQPVKKLVVHK